MLACFEDIAPWYLAPALKQLRTAIPDVDFRPRQGRFEELARGMSQGDIHLAITYDLGFDASFDRTVLAHVGPVAFLSPEDELSRKQTLKFKDLATRPLILFDEGLSIRHMLTLFRAQGLRPRIAHRASSLELMRSLAAHGEGIGISYTVPPGSGTYDGTQVSAVPIDEPDAIEEIVLVSSGLGNLHPRMADIVALFKELKFQA